MVGSDVSLSCSYKRSAALSQFVIHRGLIISVMQVSKVYCGSVRLFILLLLGSNLESRPLREGEVRGLGNTASFWLRAHSFSLQAVFCAMFYFAAVALYEGVLMVG